MLPVVLSIAGSDSSGGAGIQADIKTIMAFGCYGATAITAVTCQNTTGVTSVSMMDPEFVACQIQSVFEDFHVASIKSGMLGNADIMMAVANTIKKYKKNKPYILDPVMVATSGSTLTKEQGPHAWEVLIELADLITPNIPEASALSGMKILDYEQMKEAAVKLYHSYQVPILLKGGHLQENVLIDIFYNGRMIEEFISVKIDTKHTHGTGCTLSSAIASCFAKNEKMSDSIKKARDYVFKAIQHAPHIGRGNGPLNHNVLQMNPQD